MAKRPFEKGEKSIFHFFVFTRMHNSMNENKKQNTLSTNIIYTMINAGYDELNI